MFKKVLVINGDTLTIPELKQFNGKKIEITFKELAVKKKKNKNLMKYFGILEPDGDPLEFQKKVRAEWDEREKSY